MAQLTSLISVQTAPESAIRLANERSWAHKRTQQSARICRNSSSLVKNYLKEYAQVMNVIQRRRVCKTINQDDH